MIINNYNDFSNGKTRKVSCGAVCHYPRCSSKCIFSNVSKKSHEIKVMESEKEIIFSFLRKHDIDNALDKLLKLNISEERKEMFFKKYFPI